MRSFLPTSVALLPNVRLVTQQELPVDLVEGASFAEDAVAQPLVVDCIEIGEMGEGVNTLK